MLKHYLFGELRVEWLTLSLRTFLNGDLMPRVGMLRLGIQVWIECVRA